MSKQSKYIKNQRYISRFRIKNRVVTNPQQHQKQPLSYFSRVYRDRSVLNDKRITKKDLKQWVNSKIDVQSIDSNINQLPSFNQSLLSNNCLKENQLKLNNYSTSKTLREGVSLNSKRNKFEKTIQTNQSMNMIEFDTYKKSNRKQYLSYNQYEQMINQGEIKPVYFQKIALKNDQKIQKCLELQSNQSFRNQSGQNNLKKNAKIQSSKQLLEGGGMSRIKKNKSSKHLPSLPNQRQVQTILSSNLGVLSNDLIRKMLQQRQEQEMKCKKSNVCLFTQQSDIISDRDAKSLTLRDDLNSRVIKKYQKKEILSNNSKQPKLQEIENEKYRNHLNRIFEIKQNPKKSREKNNVSEDESYEIYEQNMFQYNCIYKPKKYVLKHKLEWKI